MVLVVCTNARQPYIGVSERGFVAKAINNLSKPFVLPDIPLHNNKIRSAVKIAVFIIFCFKSAIAEKFVATTMKCTYAFAFRAYKQRGFKSFSETLSLESYPFRCLPRIGILKEVSSYSGIHFFR